MCKGGRIKVWCLISRRAGDHFSGLERILEFKQYGGRKKEGEGAVAYRVKASTNMRSNSAPQLPTAWAFDRGFKAGSQRSPRQRAGPFQGTCGPPPLLRRRHDNKRRGTYTSTLIRHRDLQTNFKFTKVKYLGEIIKPARLVRVKAHFCCAI